jgi:hypothetical protein
MVRLFIFPLSSTLNCLSNLVTLTIEKGCKVHIAEKRAAHIEPYTT